MTVARVVMSQYGEDRKRAGWKPLEVFRGAEAPFPGVLPSRCD